MSLVAEINLNTENSRSFGSYINISALDFHLASTHTLISWYDKLKIENSKENYEQLLSNILTKTR